MKNRFRFGRKNKIKWSGNSFLDDLKLRIYPFSQGPRWMRRKARRAMKGRFVNLQGLYLADYLLSRIDADLDDKLDAFEFVERYEEQLKELAEDAETNVEWVCCNLLAALAPLVLEADWDTIQMEAMGEFD